LLAALDDGDRDLRLAAVEALGRLQDPSVAAPLRARLEDEDQWVRAGAAAALHVAEIQPGRSPTGSIAARLRGASRAPALVLN
jgi:hypothetical protein